MLKSFKTFFAGPETKAASQTIPLSSSTLVELFGALPSSTGAVVTPKTALKVPAVAQGVSLISGAISTLDVGIYKCTDAGREAVTDHPAAAVLKHPNAWTSWGELIGQLVVDRLLSGNGLASAVRVRDEVRELHRIDPRAVGIEIDLENASPLYRVTMIDGSVREFSWSNVIHLKGPSVDGYRGRGIVETARDAIGLAIVLEAHAARTFENGARPAGVLSYPGRLDKNQIDGLRASLAQNFNGSNGAGKTLILESGVKFDALQLTSVDTQFHELRQFQVLEISRALNIPATLLNDLTSATFSNAESLGQAFLDRTLMPLIEALEDQIARVVFTPEERSEGFEIEFDVSRFIRADVEKRFAAYKSGIESGVLLLNEARDAEGLPPVEGGDRPMRSVQTLPLNETMAPAKTAAKTKRAAQ